MSKIPLCPNMWGICERGHHCTLGNTASETLLHKLVVLWRSRIPGIRRGQILQVVVSIWIVTSVHTKCERTLLDLMQNSLDKGSLTLGCCSLEKGATMCWYSAFSPFHLGLWKSLCKKNAIVSVGSFQKCMLSSCTQECTCCLTVNSGPTPSEDWFLFLPFPLLVSGFRLPDLQP